MADKHTFKSLADLCPGADVPLGLTHGVYTTTPDGLTKAMTLCFSEDAAREVYAALAEKAERKE